jgi:iron(III) transport system substrate-binding protein
MHKASFRSVLSLFLVCFASASHAFAAEQKAEAPLHIYSSRHYDIDQKLYSSFTDKTGIPIKLVESKDDALLARLEEEGAQSEADVLVTVDAGRLWRAQQAGLLEPVNSEILKTRIPENLRDPGDAWYGFSTRARAITYNKAKVNPAEITSYADLIHPKWKGRICIRSASNIYNLSLLASMISLQGADAAESWAKGLLANLARKPEGGDTDQIKAVAAGVCDIALANSYYYARLVRSEKQEDKDVVENVGILLFDQKDSQTVSGTHINISGAAVLKSSDNKIAALQFLEYLASDEAQNYFSDGNNEYPVVEGLAPNTTLTSFGSFKAQDINVREYGVHQKQAQMIFDTIAFP